MAYDEIKKLFNLNKLAERNTRAGRKNLTAQELAVLSERYGADDTAGYSTAPADEEQTVEVMDRTTETKRAASMGFFQDTFSFVHIFTKNVDFTVNGTRFRGKDGLQVRGGAVPVGKGLVVDLTPVMMIGQVSENKQSASKVRQSEPAKIVVYNSLANEITELEGEEYVKVESENGKGFLKVTSQKNVSLPAGTDGETIEGSGFTLDQSGMDITNPVYSKDGQTESLGEAKVGKSGLITVKKESETKKKNMDAGLAEDEMENRTEEPVVEPEEEAGVESGENPAGDAIDKVLGAASDYVGEKAQKTLASALGNTLGADGTLDIFSNEKSKTANEVKKEEEEEKKKKEENKDGEVTLVKTLVQGMMPDFLTEMFPSLEDSKNKQAWDYAKKNIGNYFSGKPIEEPPSGLYTEEEETETRKLPEIGINITLLPGLKAGIGLEPDFSIKLVPKLNIRPQEGAGAKMVDAAVNQFFEGIDEKRSDAFDNMKDADIKKRTKNAVVAAVDQMQLNVEGSLSLAGEFNLTAMAYLLADASYLFSVKGGLIAKLGLAGAGENSSVASIGVSQEIDFENGKPKFGDRVLNLKAGFGMSAAIGIKAEIESKLFGVEKEFEKDFAEWDLFKLEYERALKLNNTGASAGGFLKPQGEKDKLEDPWNNVGAVHSAFNASVLGRQISDVRKDSFGFRVVQRAEGVSELIKKSREAETDMKKLMDGWKKLMTDPEEKLALEDGKEEMEGAETKDKGDLEAQEREAIRKRLLYLAGTYAMKRDAVNAQIREIDSKIIDIQSSDHYRKNVGEANQNVSKHTQLLEQMKQWREGNQNATGAEALAAYRAFKGNGKSANFDKYAEARRSEEARKEVGTKQNIIEYEKKRAAELGKSHQERLEKLDAYLAEHNLSKEDKNQNAEFAAFYLGLGGKGMKNELARYVNKKETVQSYEQERYDQLTQKHTERIAKINQFVQDHSLDKNKPNGELLEYYKTTLGGSKVFEDVYANFADVDMLRKYEEDHLAEDEKTAWHYNIYLQIKDAKQKYDAAQTPEEKESITERARQIMFGKDLGQTKGKDHYDIETFRKKSYRMAEKQDMIDYEKNWKAHGMIDTAFLNHVDSDLEEIKQRMADNTEDTKSGSHITAYFILKKLGYEDPYDFVKENIQLDTILRYEKAKMQMYYDENNLESYMKHQVCVQEITNAMQQIQAAKHTEAQADILKQTRQRYFSGEMRPKILPTQRKEWLRKQVRKTAPKFERHGKKSYEDLKKESSLMAIRNFELEEYQYCIGKRHIKDADKHIQCVNILNDALIQSESKSGDEREVYEDKVKQDYFSGKMAQETEKKPKERKDFLNQVKRGKVDLQTGYTAEGYVKSTVSVQELIDYEKMKVEKSKDKDAKHLNSLNKLEEAGKQILALAMAGKAVEANRLSDKVMEDYCSGELVEEERLAVVKERTQLLSEAYQGRIQGEGGKLFIDKDLYAKLLTEYQEHNGKVHEERAAALEEAAETGSDAEVYERYKQMGGGARFREIYNKQNENITAEDLTIDQMMRYSTASLQKASKQGWLIRKKKAVMNFFRTKNPFMEGLSDEEMDAMARAGHFGRLAMIIEAEEEIKPAEDGSNEAEVDKQREKIMQQYAAMTGDGGKGLAKDMENNLHKIVTPQMLLKYETSRKNKLGGKHDSRLKWLERKDDVLTEDDMAEYRNMAKEDGSTWKDHANFILSLMSRRYQTGLDKALDPAQIMTPAAVYSYEERKYEEATAKHRERIAMLDSTDETQENVWDKYQEMGGGSAFLKSLKADVQAAEKESQGESVEYQEIIDYEQTRADLYLKQKDLVQENITKLSEQKLALQRTLDQSGEALKGIESITSQGDNDTASTEKLNAMIEKIMNLRKSKLNTQAVG